MARQLGRIPGTQAPVPTADGTSSIEVFQPGEDSSMGPNRGLPDVANFDAQAFAPDPEVPAADETEVIDAAPEASDTSASTAASSVATAARVEVVDNGFGDEEVSGPGGSQDGRTPILGSVIRSARQGLRTLTTLASEREDAEADTSGVEPAADEPIISDTETAIVAPSVDAGSAEQNIEPATGSDADVRSNSSPSTVIPPIPGLDIVHDRRAPVRDRHVGVDGSGLGVFDAAPDPTTHNQTMEHPVVPHIPGDPLIGSEHPATVARQQEAPTSNEVTVPSPAEEGTHSGDVLPFMTKEQRRRAANAEIVRAQQERKAAEAARIQSYQVVESQRIGQFIEAGIDHRYYVGGVERPELLGLDNFGQMHYYLRAQVAAELALPSGVAWDQIEDPSLLGTEAAQVKALINRQTAFACNERGVDLKTELDIERRSFVIDKVGKTTETMTERALNSALPLVYQGLGGLLAPPTSEEIKAARKAGLPGPERLTPVEAMAKHREQAAIDLFVRHAGLNREGPHAEFDILEGSRKIIVWDDLIPVRVDTGSDGGEPDALGHAKYEAQLDPNVQGIAKLRRLFPQDNNVPDGSNFMVEGIFKPAGEEGGFMVAGLLSQVGVAPMYPEIPTYPQRNGLHESVTGSTLPATISVGDRELPRTRTVMEFEVRHLTDPAFGWLADSKLAAERQKARGGSRAQLETIHPSGVGEIWATGLWNNVMPTLEHVSQQVAEAEAAAKAAFEDHLASLGDHVLLRQQAPRVVATAHSPETLELGGRFTGAIEASAVTAYGPATSHSLAELVAVTGPKHDIKELQALQDAEVTLNFS